MNSSGYVHNPKLLDRLKRAIQRGIHRIRTEQANVHWAGRNTPIHNKRLSNEAVTPEINADSTYIATEKRASGINRNRWSDSSETGVRIRRNTHVGCQPSRTFRVDSYSNE